MGILNLRTQMMIFLSFSSQVIEPEEIRVSACLPRTPRIALQMMTCVMLFTMGDDKAANANGDFSSHRRSKGRTSRSIKVAS